MEDTREGTRTTGYEVRVLGIPWGAHLHAGTLASLADHAEYLAAFSVDVSSSERMEYPQAEDETDMEHEARMVECAADHKLGDFSEVVAYEITRCETLRAVEGWAGPDTRPVGEESTYITHKTYTTLRAFTDDQRDAWDICMCEPYGEED